LKNVFDMSAEEIEAGNYYTDQRFKHNSRVKSNMNCRVKSELTVFDWNEKQVYELES
jgi:hypothetical protein